jgi:hypothetical protein
MGSAVTGSAPPDTGTAAPAEEESAAPAGDQGHARRAAPDGVAIVMPAYREEQNLATTVADFLRVPE